MNYLKLNETRHMTLYGPQYFLVCFFFKCPGRQGIPFWACQRSSAIMSDLLWRLDLMQFWKLMEQSMQATVSGSNVRPKIALGQPVQLSGKKDGFGQQERQTSI